MFDASSFHRHPAHVLLDIVVTAEQNLIAGIATPDEIDAYALAQLELAGRTRLEFVLDPRD